MTNYPSTTLVPDLGVPAARNARIYAVVGLGITAIVGLLLWDLLGIILGAPFALIGLVRGVSSLRRTRDYPADRRAAITAIVAGAASFALWIPIFLSAMK